MNVIESLIGQQVRYYEDDEVLGMSFLFTDDIVTNDLASRDVASAQIERVEFITGVGSKWQCRCCFGSNMLEIVIKETQNRSLRRQLEGTQLGKCRQDGIG